MGKALNLVLVMYYILRLHLIMLESFGAEASVFTSAVEKRKN
jgi:hypothetical protein